MNNMQLFRKQQNLTLSELSNITGLSSGYLSHLEKGTRSNPSHIVMEKISNALGKSISDTFFYKK